MGDLYDFLGQRCRCGHTVHSHSHGSDRCESCRCMRFERAPRPEPEPRPTIQVMDGETGEDDAGEGLRWVYVAGPNTWLPSEMEGVESGYFSLPGCTAPTPRAP